MSTKRTRISPRIRLRENDANAGQRPASIEDGRAKKPSSGGAIGFSSPFSDERTIFFTTENNILFPTMLPSGSLLVDTTGIVATGRMTPGASDIHWNLTNQTLLPYVDTKVIVSSSFYLDPVDGLVTSFGGPLSSRASIEIDISTPSEKFIYRCAKRHIDADPTEFSVEGTGFCYYNFVNKSWDDVGNVDPGSGESLKTDQAAVAQLRTSPSYAPVDISVITSSVYYTGQFIPPNHFNQRGKGDIEQPSKAEIFGMGGKKIGTPTATFLAPGASKYHADASHVIRMSDFISTPFLLEKIKVDLPIVARRTQTSSSYYNPNLNSYAANDLHCRDMDNYVVFLYRQVRNAQPIALQRGVLKRDSIADVSGSDRFLIASASMCFYNSPTTNRGLFGNKLMFNLGDFPFHTPTFKYDFNLPTAPGLTSNPPLQQAFYSGSVSLEMVPSIYASGLAGSSYLPSTMSNSESVVDINARNGWRINYIQHAWPGTAGSVALGNGTIRNNAGLFIDYSGKTKDNFASTVPISFDTYTLTSSITPLTSSYTTILNTAEYAWDPFLLRVQRTRISFFRNTTSPMSLLNPDPRSFKGVFGPTSAKGTELSSVSQGTSGSGAPQFIGGACSEGGESARTSPIILYPHDELILGIDAGISPFMRDSSSITGSFLKIRSSGATLTLYGSQVVNDERRQHLSDWQSTSNAAHMYDAGGPVLDEHLLDPLQTTMRNYHAPLLTGSFPNRSIQDLSGSATNQKFESSIGVYQDWWKYPRQVVLSDDRSTPIDSGMFSRFVFRNDKFGHPAHMLQSATSLASKVAKETVLPGSKKGGTSIESYPITNVFTGSTSYTGNTSLHATSSKPFFDS